MGLVTEVKKEDIFKREAKASSPWDDPSFNKIDDLGGEPGFKVDDIPERLGLVQAQRAQKIPSSNYYFSDLIDAPKTYGTKLQFLQTDGKGKLTWAWPFWRKAGSTVYYKSGKVAIGHAAAQTILHISTPLSSEIRIQTSGEADPTLSFKTTNTTHQVNLALDESAVADHMNFIGQTTGVDTFFHVIGKVGQAAKLGVQVGSYRGELICGAAGHISLKNITADLDLVLGIKDGAVNKTITWDADVDKLKHSAGLFDFDDDDIVTTGILTLSNESLHILDTNASHDLVVKAGSDLTADRILTLMTGDAAKTITLTGNPTLDNWFDQSVKVGATPTFDDLTISTPVNIYALSHDSFADYAAGEHFTMLDEDNMASNSNTQAATQQSIKAYVDASGGGASVFVDLTDTPANYAGASGKVVVVNDTPDALEFVDTLTLVGLTVTDYIYFDKDTEHVMTIGYQAGNALVGGGTYNTFLGEQAGYSFSTGDKNVAIGSLAGYFNATGLYNTYIGYKAGYGVATKNHSYNTFIGCEAGERITTGAYNFAAGYQAGRNITSGGTNFCLGYRAGYQINTGTANYVFGHEAGYGITSGGYNVYFGTAAGKRNSGSDNIAMGSEALMGVGWWVGTANIAIGRSAAKYSTTGGAYNVYIGHQAGFYANDGDLNTGIGYKAGYGVTANNRNRNIFFGAYAGQFITTGSNNILIGYEAGQDITSGTGNIVIGYMAAEGQLTTGNNQLWVANTDTATPLIYGEFDNTLIKIYDFLFLPNIKSGVDQAGAGAAAGELWKTASHATLPDNVVMIGV